MAVLPRASNKVVCFMVSFKDTLTHTNPDFFELHTFLYELFLRIHMKAVNAVTETALF